MTASFVPDPHPVPLRTIAWVFFRLGATAFGGPAAHIALMEDELVRRRRWLSREHFLDLLAAANLIPGPNSTELAIHIGHVKGGWRGLLVAGVCFIVPAAVLVSAIAWAYTRFGALPEAAGLLAGIKPVIIAVVAQALWGLGRSALKTRTLGLVAAGAVVAVLAGASEIAVLLAAGALMALTQRRRGQAPPMAAVAPLALAATGAAVPFGLWPLFGVFLKIGAVLFGSGYVLLAFLRADLVERLGWLTNAQLLDAVAVGQFTPGPVFTTATFIGYLLGGVPGAAVATVGIFLPAFVFVAASGPLVPRMRRSPAAGAFLDGVVAASLALMAIVTVQLAQSALVGPWSVAIALAGAFGLMRLRLNSAWLVAGGALAGLLGQALGWR